MTVNKATPTINWTTPAAVDFGTVLSTTQLNATASVPGTFAYTPASGTILNPDGVKTLSTVFTPADTTNYNNTTASVSITVNPAPNQAPTMTAIANTTITAPTAFSYQVAASDPEKQALVYTLTGNPAGMTISSTGIINWNASVAGTYTIKVMATDPGNLSAIHNFTLTVNNTSAQQPPVITSSPVTSAYRNLQYQYAVKATDPNGDVLRYELTRNPYGMVIDSQTGLISWTPSKNGIDYVTIRVTDSVGAYTTQNFTIIVKSARVSGAPSIISGSSLINAVKLPKILKTLKTVRNIDTDITAD
jgi:hypothetical protein